MDKSVLYQSVASDVVSLGAVVPRQLAEVTASALSKLNEALGGDVSGYVANRLHFSKAELGEALAAEQVDGVALAMYNIEKRAESVIIGDQTGIGKGRQAASMIRYGLLSGYIPVFFTDRYTLFSDMYRDCKALGIKDARPLVVNAGVAVVDFDHCMDGDEADTSDEIWSPIDDDEDNAKIETELMQLYQEQYEVVYKAPKKKILQEIFERGDVPADLYDYLMVTYSQLKDAKRDATRLNFLQSLCEKHRVLFIFDEAHRASSVSAGKTSVITQGINRILAETPQTQCVFLSATFAKRPESLITFMRRTTLSALATENTLERALHSGGVPMQEYVASCLASEGQMIRREHSSAGIPAPLYTYLDDELVLHSVLFDKVMFFFREIVKLSAMVNDLVNVMQMSEKLVDFKCYPARAQLFYINKVLLLSLKAQKVARAAIAEVKQGRSVVIGMSDTLECILRDVEVNEDENVRGDISALLLRLMEKTIRSTNEEGDRITPVFDLVDEENPLAEEVREYYGYIAHCIREEVFHLPMSPIDVIRQIITSEQYVTPAGICQDIRFEECTGRAHQLEYLSPEGDDDYVNARLIPRRKRHSNHIFNDFQNNRLDVILINACGAIGASAHAISTAEVAEQQVRQRKMLIVQNDLDVNIDLQKRGRINRTGQRMDLPPLYEYIITAIPSEKRLNMMLRAKLRSLSANTAAWQDQDREQADFIDISNKYGNQVATDYISEHPELACLLGLKGTVTASKLLARIAMLSVTAQQEIIDDLLAEYTSLEAELRRINQWDLEREFRDFEAEYVREELFTTAKADTRLGGCSYLTVYKCKQKTFPYPYKTLMDSCEAAKVRYGKPFGDNPGLQKQVRDYYMLRNKNLRSNFKERQRLLHDGAKRILVNYCKDDSLAESWLQRACSEYDTWQTSYFGDVDGQPKAKQIMRKLISYSNEYNHLLEREKAEVKKNAAEKKRLVTVLSMAVIGEGYSDISSQMASEENPGRVIAVLRDIRFGKEERNWFQPSRVELVFALSAVYTEIRINLVHNKNWSNYERLVEILGSEKWCPYHQMWESEIAMHNNKIVERKIVTGNILGAYVHPAIAELKPRFITFSLRNGGGIQTGLLLPMDESKIRDALRTVSIPLNEGIRYATNTNTSYTIAGLGVLFSLLPYRVSDSSIRYVISVSDKNSKEFENDKCFDTIRSIFVASAVTSIYDRDESSKGKRRSLTHYQTELLDFESDAFQCIIQTLSMMDAVIIVPRDQITYGEVKEFKSHSEVDQKEPWAMLDWRNESAVPMPPVREKLLSRISAPLIPKEQKGIAVSKHSEHYDLAYETMSLEGLNLRLRSTLDALRRSYMNWKAYNERFALQRFNSVQGQPSWSAQRDICNELRIIIENKRNADTVGFDHQVKKMLQQILDSEYLEPEGKVIKRFNDEMLFLSPDKAEAQAFMDDMPCSPSLNAIRRCLQDYIDGKTDIVNSPELW